MINKFLNSIKVLSAEEMNKEYQWLSSQVKRLGEKKLTELVKNAVKVRKLAYQPYSHYAVGAAILCRSGKIFAAPNTEVVSYSQTGHAESNAISKAISEGEGLKDRRFITALAVCHSGESGPCGACRQVIAEHCDNAIVIDANPKSNLVAITSLKILFPFAFTPTHLGI